LPRRRNAKTGAPRRGPKPRGIGRGVFKNRLQFYLNRPGISPHHEVDERKLENFCRSISVVLPGELGGLPPLACRSGALLFQNLGPALEVISEGLEQFQLVFLSAPNRVLAGNSVRYFCRDFLWDSRHRKRKLIKPCPFAIQKAGDVPAQETHGRRRPCYFVFEHRVRRTCPNEHENILRFDFIGFGFRGQQFGPNQPFRCRGCFNESILGELVAAPRGRTASRASHHSSFRHGDIAKAGAQGGCCLGGIFC